MIKALILLSIFLSFYSVDKQPKVLDPKLPVLLLGNKSFYDTKLEVLLTNKLKEKKFIIIDKEKAHEIIMSEFNNAAIRKSSSKKQKIDIVAHTKEIMFSLPFVYQTLTITILMSENKKIDSCYYAVNYIPSKSKSNKIALVDSIVKTNNVDILVNGITELASPKNN